MGGQAHAVDDTEASARESTTRTSLRRSFSGRGVKLKANITHAHTPLRGLAHGQFHH